MTVATTPRAARLAIALVTALADQTAEGFNTALELVAETPCEITATAAMLLADLAGRTTSPTKLRLAAAAVAAHEGPGLVVL
jgi:hypothetical protein